MGRRSLNEDTAKVSTENFKLKVGTSADPLSPGCIERMGHRFSQCLCRYLATKLGNVRGILSARLRCAYRATDQERSCLALLVHRLAVHKEKHDLYLLIRST